MDLYRLYHSIRLCFILSAQKRAQYLGEKHVFKSIGKHCIFMPRKVPLYPNLIKLGDYVDISTGVSFNTHDGIHTIIGSNNEMLPEELKKHKFHESLGCIEIGNHVFVSANCSIANNVRIGDNVMITANSVVTNDIPSNSVVRGNPAKVICTFTQFLSMKAAKKSYPEGMDHKMGKYVGKELEDWLWNEFYTSRK